MKAARVHRFGEPLQVDEVEEPVAGPGEVVVDIDHVGVNPLDIWVTRGTVAGGQQPLPWVPGVEATGTVAGQRYFVYAPGAGTVRPGLYQQRAAVPESALIPLPPGADPAQAAVMGVAGVTAWRLVRDVARVGPEDRVLVLGASGGVGCLLVQLALGRGATVWGQTGSADKADAITSMGAERVVVASVGELAAAAADLRPTVAFDPLAGPFTPALVEALQPHGRLAIFGTSAGQEATIDMRALYRKGLSLLGYSGMVEPAATQRAALVEVLGELAAGRLRVPVAEVLPLDAAAEAHRRILDREVSGKLVLAP